MAISLTNLANQARAHYDSIKGHPMHGYLRNVGRVGKLALGVNVPEWGMEAATPVKNMFSPSAWKAAGAMKTLGTGALALGGYAFSAGYIASEFQQGGMWGGVKAIGQQAAFNYVIGTLGFVGGGAAIAAGYGAYKLAVNSPYIARRIAAGRMNVRGLAAEYTHKFRKEQGELDMVGNVADPFGTVATMRQRSIQAIQGSKLNGRVALGQEASIVHRGWY